VLWRGAGADASALQAQWPVALASEEPDLIVPAALALAEAAWLRGEHPECASVVRLALTACADLTAWDWSELALWAHRAGQDPPGHSRAQFVQPCALELQGDLAGAASAWAERGMPRHQAYALMLMDPRQNPDALAEAIALFDQAGAIACAEYARRLARKWAGDGVKGIKTGPRGAARSNRFGLTQRELQVAQQVAAGLSNPEIAKTLSRSPRTVENHVATVLDKLGAKRRGDVAALLAGAE
jgi:DNA-binding CsgD family transcriptional regulator